MGILVLMLLIIGLCSFLIARVAYNRQVKNDYKSPMLTASIVFIISFFLIGAAIFLLIVNNIQIER